jgi:hypothetical protein
MRNIRTSSEYNELKETFTQKIAENDVSKSEAKAIVEKNLPKAENYQSIVLKLIPTEVVGAYIFISGLIPQANSGLANSGNVEDKYRILHWIIFGLLFIINPLYLRYASSVTNKKQIIICTLGFAVWAFSLGNPFMTIGGNPDFSRLIGSIVLALYTLIVPMFLKETTK